MFFGEVTLTSTAHERTNLVTLVPMIVTTGAGTHGYNYCVELH